MVPNWLHIGNNAELLHCQLQKANNAAVSSEVISDPHKQILSCIRPNVTLLISFSYSCELWVPAVDTALLTRSGFTRKWLADIEGKYVILVLDCYQLSQTSWRKSMHAAKFLF